jgi:16S rRNA (cytosine967-C5)-methyltransferase
LNLQHAQSYLRTAADIIDQYDGSAPFAAWLKQYFKLHKKHGSKDRKAISQLCYCYFRPGKSPINKTIEEKIVLALYLCSPTPNDLLAALDEKLNEQAALPLTEKLSAFELSPLGELKEELSKEIEPVAFENSFFIQPDLFVRIRPGEKNLVLGKLKEAGVAYKEVNENCLALPNTTRLEEILDIDGEVVIQDKNSQEVLNAFVAEWKDKDVSVWDCCCASGGKSILAYDWFPGIRLTVSDIRESILHNLRSRFHRADIRGYKSLLLDVGKPGFHYKQKFDLVICDAPCSGSGTWSRTPEQLHFFEKEQIDRYAELQRSIALNAVKSVKESGYFLYITCSVFSKENEEVVDSILKDTSLRLISASYHKGYNEKADTLFSAMFHRDQ